MTANILAARMGPAAISGMNLMLDSVFAQIERVPKINRLETITREVVEVAREGLSVGTT